MSMMVAPLAIAAGAADIALLIFSASVAGGRQAHLRRRYCLSSLRWFGRRLCLRLRDNMQIPGETERTRHSSERQSMTLRTSFKKVKEYRADCS
jgi:hypothetical protein